VKIMFSKAHCALKLTTKRGLLDGLGTNLMSSSERAATEAGLGWSLDKESRTFVTERTNAHECTSGAALGTCSDNEC
jgi:hypothetical protein